MVAKTKKTLREEIESYLSTTSDSPYSQSYEIMALIRLFLLKSIKDEMNEW